MEYAELRPGDQGEWVQYLQGLLAEKGYPVGAVDGSYGPGTAAAVAKLQADHGLPADEGVGAGTWAVLAPPAEPAAVVAEPAAEGAGKVKGKVPSGEELRALLEKSCPTLFGLVNYPADEAGAAQFLRDLGMPVDLFLAWEHGNDAAFVAALRG
jgi:hypothetical protein